MGAPIWQSWRLLVGHPRSVPFGQHAPGTIPSPSPRPSGERAGARGFDPGNDRPPHPGPAPLRRRGRKTGQCVGALIWQSWRLRVGHPRSVPFGQHAPGTIPSPSPRPSGERAGARGFDPGNNRPPHPDPAPLRRRGRKTGQCVGAPIWQSWRLLVGHPRSVPFGQHAPGTIPSPSPRPSGVGRQGWTPRRSFGRVAGQFKTPIACNIRRTRMALAWNE